MGWKTTHHVTWQKKLDFWPDLLPTCWKLVSGRLERNTIYEPCRHLRQMNAANYMHFIRETAAYWQFWTNRGRGRPHPPWICHCKGVDGWGGPLPHWPQNSFLAVSRFSSNKTRITVDVVYMINNDGANALSSQPISKLWGRHSLFANVFAPLLSSLIFSRRDMLIP